VLLEITQVVLRIVLRKVEYGANFTYVSYILFSS
jgi:hypothetical protein